MSTPAKEYTLAELCIVACAEAFRDSGEALATGIGVIPRIAASLAMKTFNPDLMMTDGEAMMVGQPNPLSRSDDYVQANENRMGYQRIFDNVWSRKRHAMLGPVQVDRWGQTNTSALGGTYEAPKTQMLGARGFPGNSISHPNSFFVPGHNRRVFVEAEVDFVSSIGYNPDRLPKGHSLQDIDIVAMITDLCVMDFGGPGHQVRLLSLHPGINVEQVVENTGFEISLPDSVPVTTAPTEEQLAIIAEIDANNARSFQLKDNPPGDRS